MWGGELKRADWLNKMIMRAVMANESLFPVNTPRGFT